MKVKHMKLKHFIIMWVIIFVIGFGYCYIAKKTHYLFDYTKISNKTVMLNDYGTISFDKTTPWRWNKNISEMDMSKQSDLIVKVKCLSTIGRNNCALATVDVLETYKGEAYAGKIDVYQFGEMLFENKYVAHYGCTVMLPDEEYILYLQYFENPYSGEKSYLLVNIYYGKMPLKGYGNMEVLPFNKANYLVYSDIMDWGIIPMSEEIKTHYIDIWNEVTSKWSS